mmetsp:Transcript_1228/g.3493  ORF Transcript_1228/g.3493 Transcript_1228/m.3493 type:complete len:215 (-) Transcript_1228:825-1469(-)
MGGTGEVDLDLFPPATAVGRGLLLALTTRPNGSGKDEESPPLDGPFRGREDSVVPPSVDAAPSSSPSTTSSVPPPHAPKMSARSGRMPPRHPTPSTAAAPSAQPAAVVTMAIPSPHPPSTPAIEAWLRRCRFLSIRRFRPPWPWPWAPPSPMAREVPSALTRWVIWAVAMVLVGLGEEVDVGEWMGRGGERRGRRPLEPSMLDMVPVAVELGRL